MMGVGQVARLAAAGAAVALAGCGGQAGSVAESESASTKFGNLLAFNSTSAPAGPGKVVGPTIDCPIVQVEPGASAVRVGGEASASVRYQIAIGDVARECALVNGQLTIRVGVETRTIIGPAGSAGSYSAPLTVAVRRTGDEKVLAAKTYRVGGAVSGTGAAIHSLIADPLSVPYINERAADDYEIVLAMGQSVGPSKRRR